MEAMTTDKDLIGEERGARCDACKHWQVITITRPVFKMHGHPDSSDYTDGPACEKCGHILWMLYLDWRPDEQA